MTIESKEEEGKAPFKEDNKETLSETKSNEIQMIPESEENSFTIENLQ